MELRKLTANDVTFTIEPHWEEDSPDGYFTERADVEWVKDQIEAGNIWGWCWVKVSARWHGHTGYDTLGGCSYLSEEDFTQPGGYYDDMKQEALDSLNRVLASYATTIAGLEVMP